MRYCPELGTYESFQYNLVTYYLQYHHKDISRSFIQPIYIYIGYTYELYVCKVLWTLGSSKSVQFP